MKNILSNETQFNLSFVTIIVSDMQRSIDFNTGQLGLTLKSRYGDEFAVVELRA
jgi:catechol 2,3-dioxygenase-like lactoylglutathione lyase family enzyme